MKFGACAEYLQPMMSGSTLRHPANASNSTISRPTENSGAAMPSEAGEHSQPVESAVAIDGGKHPERDRDDEADQLAPAVNDKATGSRPGSRPRPARGWWRTFLRSPCTAATSQRQNCTAATH